MVIQSPAVIMASVKFLIAQHLRGLRPTTHWKLFEMMGINVYKEKAAKEKTV